MNADPVIPAPDPTEPRPSRTQRLASPGPWIILTALAGMSWISWRKWMDPLIDYGQQVYIPWQLSQGQVLYRDIFYTYGPLSSYLHALLFKLSGPGILILALFNIALVAVLAFLIHQIFKDLFDEKTASVASLMFIVIFAFGHYNSIGIFSFVAPYSYELPHGILLSFLAIHQLMRYGKHPGAKRLFLIGLLSGLTFLTKAEIFLAEVSAIAAGLILITHSHGISYKHKLKLLPILFSGFAIPLLAFGIYFSVHMPVAEALRSLVLQWIYVFNSDIKSLPYFKIIMGTDDTSASILRMLVGLMTYALLFVLLAGVHRLLIRCRWGALKTSIITALVPALIVLYFRNEIPWDDGVRPLPLILTGYGIFLAWPLFKNFGQSQAKERLLPLITLALFSLILLFKIFLNVHVFHYGFALALPGTLLLAGILIYEFPNFVDPSPTHSRWISIFFLACLLIFTGIMAQRSYSIYRMKTFPVGEGMDRIYGYVPESFATQKIAFTPEMAFQFALEVIAKEMAPDETFVTLPESPLLNYLSRRANPVETIVFNSGVWVLTGEKPLLNSLKAKRPDYIIFVHRDFKHFSRRFFGKDYATATFEWIQANYRVFQTIGHPPFTEKGFGIQILKMRDSFNAGSGAAVD